MSIARVILCFDSLGVGELRRVAFVSASSSILVVLCVVAAGIECSNVYVAATCCDFASYFVAVVVILMFSCYICSIVETLQFWGSIVAFASTASLILSGRGF
jgi:hypothetical protein